MLDGLEKLMLNASVAERIWKPNLYIYDFVRVQRLEAVDQSDYHSILATNDVGSEIVRLTMTDILEVKITCGFNHTYFPFDSQTCFFRYGLSDFNSSFVVFEKPAVKDWTLMAGRLGLQVTRLRFDRAIQSLESTQFQIEEELMSYTGLQIQFRRRSLTYVFAYFVPMFLFVVMSWLSFVIHIDQVGNREENLIGF